ncbi:MAG: hypothetical protein O2826_05825 [Chloroflexi bacterium]|nr:hypothetical protein [Chloroflexota bacterium]
MPDIAFEMKLEYLHGESIAITIVNNSDDTYYYQRHYPACYNLKFFDDPVKERTYPEETRPLEPGEFLVPEGTHCDMVTEDALPPGARTTLLVWERQLCEVHLWGCLESVPAGPGTYRIEGRFSTKREVVGYSKEDDRGTTTAEWSFAIAEPPPIEDTFDLQLIAPETINQGEWLEGLDVILTDTSGQLREFASGAGILDFEVTDARGNVIWQNLKVIPLPLVFRTIHPYDVLSVADMHMAAPGKWDLRDPNGIPVEPGEYQLTGIVSLGGARMTTAAQTLTVLPAPLPDYAHSMQLELLAPPTFATGQPVPLDMRVTNTGNAPVSLLWSGGGQFPPFHYLDILIYRDDAVIWRASLAHGLRGSGDFILAPGEGRTMSSLFEGYGAPWFWDQSQGCGDNRDGACEDFVGPGTYIIRGAASVTPPWVLEQDPPFTLKFTTVTTPPQELIIVSASAQE